MLFLILQQSFSYRGLAKGILYKGLFVKLSITMLSKLTLFNINFKVLKHLFVSRDIFIWFSCTWHPILFNNSIIIIFSTLYTHCNTKESSCIIWFSGGYMWCIILRVGRGCFIYCTVYPYQLGHCMPSREVWGRGGSAWVLDVPLLSSIWCPGIKLTTLPFFHILNVHKSVRIIKWILEMCSNFWTFWLCHGGVFTANQQFIDSGTFGTELYFMLIQFSSEKWFTLS